MELHSGTCTYLLQNPSSSSDLWDDLDLTLRTHVLKMPRVKENHDRNRMEFCCTKVDRRKNHGVHWQARQKTEAVAVLVGGNVRRQGDQKQGEDSRLWTILPSAIVCQIRVWLSNALSRSTQDVLWGWDLNYLIRITGSFPDISSIRQRSDLPKWRETSTAVGLASASILMMQICDETPLRKDCEDLCRLESVR